MTMIFGLKKLSPTLISIWGSLKTATVIASVVNIDPKVCVWLYDICDSFCVKCVCVFLYAYPKIRNL